MTKIEQLRADLEVLERYSGDHIDIREAEKAVKLEIATLEAAADPWREAKKSIDHWRNCGMWPDITGLYDHLSTENARLEKRVKELEAEGKSEDDTDILTEDDRKALESICIESIIDHAINPVADMQPPFKGPIESIEPVLDPARVLATARKLFIDTDFGRHNRETIAEVIQILGIQHGSRNAKPYRLKGTDE